MQPTESKPKELLRGQNGAIIPGAAHSWRLSGDLLNNPKLSKKFAAWAGGLPKNIVTLPDFGEYTPAFFHHFADYLLKDEVQWQYADIRGILVCALHWQGVATTQQVEKFFAEHGQRIAQDTAARQYALYQLLLEMHGKGGALLPHLAGGPAEGLQALQKWKEDLSSRNFPESVLTCQSAA